MRIGFQVVLFVLILNLVATAVYVLELPGTKYSRIVEVGQEANATAYAEKFNATTLLDRWTATPFSGIPIFGDIFSLMYLLYNAIRSVILGFPDLLNNIAYQINDVPARNSVLVISGLVYAVFSFIIFVWVFQLITGRRVSE